MTKKEIENLLTEKTTSLVEFYNKQKGEAFTNRPEPGKWNSMHHLQHLTISTKRLRQAISLPGIILRYKFGVNNRNERSYSDMITKYRSKLNSAKTMKQPSRFDPEKMDAVEKERLLEDYQKETKLLLRKSNNWSEKKLSTYILPHPLLGKLTLREMLLFTALHTEHHLHILKEKY